jgi:hypothetical protein
MAEVDEFVCPQIDPSFSKLVRLSVTSEMGCGRRGLGCKKVFYTSCIGQRIINPPSRSSHCCKSVTSPNTNFRGDGPRGEEEGVAYILRNSNP